MPGGADTDAMTCVRAASMTDAAVIARLLTQLDYPCSGDEVRLRLGYWLDDPASRILLAEQERAVIGCLSLHAVPYLERTGRWCRIESLVVDQAARGSGAGRALLAAAEEQARDWGCLLMEVTSLRTRTGAHAFYQQMGYTDGCGRSGRFLKELR